MRIFDVDNPVFNFIGKIGDIFLLNFLWLLTSLPIITLGASTSAMLGTAVKMVNGTETPIIKKYFKAFKQNFKQSTIIFLIMAVAGLVLAVDIWFWVNNESSSSYIFLAFSLGLCIPYISVLVYVFAVLARFENTIKGTIKNSFFIAIKHLRFTFTLLMMVVVLIIINYTVLLVSYFTLIFGIGLFAYLSGFVYVEVFRNYEPKPVVSKYDIYDNEKKDKPIKHVFGRAMKVERN